MRSAGSSKSRSRREGNGEHGHDQSFRYAGQEDRAAARPPEVLESENEKLKADLAAARKAEKDAGDSRGAVERLEREQDLVRERLEKLIHALEAAEEKKS